MAVRIKCQEDGRQRIQKIRGEIPKIIHDYPLIDANSSD